MKDLHAFCSQTTLHDLVTDGLLVFLDMPVGVWQKIYYPDQKKVNSLYLHFLLTMPLIHEVVEEQNNLHMA